MVNKDNDHRRRRRSITQLTFIRNIIPNLPNDICFEILSWLPPKSLSRFKSVCKTWLNLFSSPYFVKVHLDHTLKRKDKENDTLIVCSTDDATCKRVASLLQIKSPTTTFNLDHPPYDSFCGMDLIGSINGLICLARLPQTLEITIWNPITKKYKYLPCPTVIPLEASVGFGYDSATRDYFVVRIVLFENENVRQVELYSVNSDSWETLKDCVVDFPVYSWICNAIVKGEPNWLSGRFGETKVVMRFDVSNKCFRQVPQLRIPYGRAGQVRLLDHKGSLAMLVVSHLSLSSLTSEFLGLDNSSTKGCVTTLERNVSMLVLNGDGSWRVEFRVCFPHEIGPVLGWSENGRIVLLDKLGMVVLFNTKIKETENTGIVGATGRSFVVGNYTPSFVPIKGSECVPRRAY